MISEGRNSRVVVAMVNDTRGHTSNKVKREAKKKLNEGVGRAQSKKASSLNLRLSASSMSLVSLRMLPILCIVGLIAVRGAWLA